MLSMFVEFVSEKLLTALILNLLFVVRVLYMDDIQPVYRRYALYG